MALNITLENVMDIMIAVFLALAILVGFTSVTDPDFLEAKTMSNTMFYVESIADKNTKVNLLKENDNIAFTSSDEDYSLSIKNNPPFKNKYTTNREYEKQDNYIILT